MAINERAWKLRALRYAFFAFCLDDLGHDRLGESRASVLRVSLIVWSNPIESGVGVLGVEFDHTGSGRSGNGLCRFWTAFTESLYDMRTFCVLHPCFVRLGQRCSDHTACSHSIQIRQSMTPLDKKKHRDVINSLKNSFFLDITWDSNPHYRALHASPDKLRIHTNSSKLLHIMILHLKALFEYALWPAVFDDTVR